MGRAFTGFSDVGTTTLARFIVVWLAVKSMPPPYQQYALNTHIEKHTLSRESTRGFIYFKIRLTYGMFITLSLHKYK